jgi:hypothetical protein
MYKLLNLKGAWMPQCNMSKHSGTVLVASLKPYAKHIKYQTKDQVAKQVPVV